MAADGHPHSESVGECGPGVWASLSQPSRSMIDEEKRFPYGPTCEWRQFGEPGEPRREAAGSAPLASAEAGEAW